MIRKILAVTAIAALLASCSSSRADDAGASAGVRGTAVVFAAASLQDTFTTLAKQFERSHPGAKIVPSFGGSDSLAAQITQGAPVDVFASANTSTMGAVTKAGDAKTPAAFATNELEIAVEPGNPLRIATLADVTKPGVKLALCAPSVPCGAAAAKAFAVAKLVARPVTLERDVTSVLTKVELGEVDAGIVYQTDVKTAGKKVTGIDFPEAGHAANTYSIAVVTTGKNPLVGQAFVDFVRSPDGQSVLRQAGFRPAPTS